ncbi:MAG: hypothetical protein WBV90_16635 [Terrimicrobiaceae bacterium]
MSLPLILDWLSALLAHHAERAGLLAVEAREKPLQALLFHVEVTFDSPADFLRYDSPPPHPGKTTASIVHKLW